LDGALPLIAIALHRQDSSAAIGSRAVCWQPASIAETLLNALWKSDQWQNGVENATADLVSAMGVVRGCYLVNGIDRVADRALSRLVASRHPIRIGASTASRAVVLDNPRKAPK
jgi:hypothetical protein